MDRGIPCWVQHIQAGSSLPKCCYALSDVGHTHLPLPLLHSAMQSSNIAHCLVGSSGASSVNMIRVTSIRQELNRTQEGGGEGGKRRGEEGRDERRVTHWMEHATICKDTAR